MHLRQEPVHTATCHGAFTGRDVGGTYSGDNAAPASHGSEGGRGSGAGIFQWIEWDHKETWTSCPFVFSCVVRHLIRYSWLTRRRHLQGFAHLHARVSLFGAGRPLSWFKL